MASLLQIASRIEAAVKSYVSVRDVTDRAEWKHHFDEEKVSALILSHGYIVSPFELGQCHP
jgi:hypothetical protein